MAKDVNLAEQALANLVNQFARPLDFLRELVQNSIDAGSPRVAVSVAYDTEDVLRIHVDDWGEGMDENIIDNQLTRLFASTKENDLTKIGKFGIGFTSIFAIQPEAVLMRTGRHGEYWELLFHADRSFDKVKIEEPVDGTRITLFKRMATDEAERFIREARWILSYWCEHSDTPITFWDQTQQEAAPEVDPEDPFAAFEADASPSGPESINQPLGIQADLSHRLEMEGTQVVIGLSRVPRYGFYNGGLTLLNTANEEALGRYAARLSHLSFKIKSDRLEHTLTRDNVLQDTHWETAMGVVVRAANELQAQLLDRAAQAAASQEPLGPWHRYIAEEVRVAGVDWLRGSAAIFRNHQGKPVTIAKVIAQERQLGAVLIDPGPGPLRDALEKQNRLMLADDEQTRRLLAISAAPSAFGGEAVRHILDASDVFVLPELLDGDGMDVQEKALIEATVDLISSAVGGRLRIRLGNFGAGKPGSAHRKTGLERARRDVLALHGDESGRVFVRPSAQSWWLPAWLPSAPAELRWRVLLVNRHHPFFQAQLLAGVEDLQLAAFGLATALLHLENIEGQRSYEALVDVAADTLEREARP